MYSSSQMRQQQKVRKLGESLRLDNNWEKTEKPHLL